MKTALLKGAALCVVTTTVAGTAVAMPPAERAGGPAAAILVADREFGNPAMVPNSPLGRPVVDARGQSIGEVTELRGNQVVISVGGFLGIGERDVLVDRDRLERMGTGSETRFRLPMTREEIEAIPKAAD